MFPYNIPCRITSFEEGAVLCNFLPLLREYLPSTAEEIEADIISLEQSEGIEASFLEMLSNSNGRVLGAFFINCNRK
jgi:hypothetical protein